MSLYRLYSIKRNGHIAGPPRVCEFPRDDDALAEAKKHLAEDDIEIWQDGRMVAYLVPDEEK